MAIRFDAQTERLRVPALTGSVCTFCCWANRRVDTNTFANFLVGYGGVETGGTECGIGTNSTGDNLTAFDSAFALQAGPAPMVIDTWYCVGLVMDGTSWTFYHGTDPASLTTVGPNTRVAITSPGSFTLSHNGEMFNGDLANVKFFDTALDAGQVATELGTYAEVTPAWALYPFTGGPELADYSGNGRNLTMPGTAPTFSPGPAVLDVRPPGAMLGAYA